MSADKLFDDGGPEFTEHVGGPVEHAALPKATERDQSITLILNCDGEEDRAALLAELGITAPNGRAWWPPGADEDPAALRMDL